MSIRGSVIISCLVSFTSLYAQQSSLKLKVQVPVQFGIGYEGKIIKRLSFQASAGILTQPNSTLIINTLDALGTDPQVVLMIEDAFKFGFVGEGGLNYNFGKNYVGAFFQLIALHGGDAPTDIVEEYFNTDINNYPTRKGRSPASDRYLKLTSTLYQGGLLYGRRFPLKSKRLEIDAELGISANLGSQSRLSSDTRDLSTLSKVVDAELAGYYADYAFVPSLAVCLVYKLGVH